MHYNTATHFNALHRTASLCIALQRSATQDAVTRALATRWHHNCCAHKTSTSRVPQLDFPSQMWKFSCVLWEVSLVHRNPKTTCRPSREFLVAVQSEWRALCCVALWAASFLLYCRVSRKPPPLSYTPGPLSWHKGLILPWAKIMWLHCSISSHLQ